MKALRWHGQRDIRIEEVPEPSPGKGEVKIKVKWCGICGTDLSEYAEGPIILPAKRPHPLTGKQPPIILGHEFSGEIVEVGSEVTGFAVGERVTVNPLIVCNDCFWCKWGRYNECARLATLGLGADGAFAEYVIAPAYGCYKLPPEVSDEMGALCETLAVLVRACKRGEVAPGDSVAVIGAGPVGLLALQTAKASGASKVFVIEPIPKRREIAKKLGATAVYDPQEVDAGKEIAKLTNGIRADVTIECVGSGPAMETALKVSRRAGKIVLVGIAKKPIEFPFDKLLFPEKDLIPVQGYVDEFPAAISFLADGRVKVESLITAKIKLDDIIEKGFKVLDSEQRAEHFKILVSPEL